MPRDNCGSCGKPLGSTLDRCHECGGRTYRGGPRETGNLWRVLMGVAG